MKISTQPYKGARDFYPEDKRLQKWLFSNWREVCERFGYEEYDAPILEPTDLFLMKGNQEIIEKETYTFEDRGGRSVTIRTEMTPTVSRMVAGRRQELSYPLRWYSIPNLWRYERPQRGRLREFWQLNADVFGVSGVEADVEIIAMADALLQQFKADRSMYRIEISSRELLNELAEKAGISNFSEFIKLVDSKAKIKEADFNSKLKLLTSGKDGFELANYVLNLRSLESLRSGLNFSSLDRVKEVILSLEKRLGIGNVTNIVFNPAIARGFAYYSGVVFEVFDNDIENNRSLMGGGRYDGLVGLFGVEPIATFGYAVGDVTFINFLQSNKLVPVLPNEISVGVIVVGEFAEEAQKIATDLRASGVNVAVDISGSKLEKQLKTAIKKNLRFALFVGSKELESGQFTLRNLVENSEETIELGKISSRVKAYKRPRN